MDKNLGIIIGGFIVVLLGLVFAQSLATSNYYVQNTEPIVDKQFTLTNLSACTRLAPVGSCVQTLTTIENVTSTGGVNPIGSGNYTQCTISQYNDGINFINANTQIDALNGLSLNATFDQSTNCMYVADGTSRTLTGLIIVFFVIGVLLIGVWIIKKSGLIDMF